MKSKEQNSRIKQAERLVSSVEKFLLGSLLVASLSCVLVQVAYRLVFGGALAWTDEASRLSLIWMTFVGAAYLMNQGKHLAVDALVGLVPTKGRAAFEVLSNFIVIITSGAIFLTGIAFVRTVGVSDSAGLSVSMAWFYGAALLGMLMVAVHGALNSLKVLHTGQPVYPIAADTVIHESFEKSDVELGAAK